VPPPCWKRGVSPGDPVVLCCAVLCGAFLFLSTVLRSSVDPGSVGAAAAVPTGPTGVPQGFVAVERKVYRKQEEIGAESAAATAKGTEAAVQVGEHEEQGEVNLLQDRIKSEKRKLRILKKRENKLKKEQDSLHVDHAKQEVLQERNLIDKEEKFERKEEKIVQKEKGFISRLRKDLNAEAKFLDHLGQDKGNLKKAEKMAKDAKGLEAGEKWQVVKFNSARGKETEKDNEVQKVADTWKDIKVNYGVSKNIDSKHTKEEKRHVKIQKKAAAAVAQFTKLEADHEQLARKQEDLERRLHEAEVASGTAL